MATRLLSAALAALAMAMIAPSVPTAEPAHAISMHGVPLYGADFDHFAYADPAAKKGGRIVYAVIGSFDSLNPLIVKGAAVQSIRGNVYESLMARGFDEPFSLYGLIAETVETAEDRSWVEFRLRETARFSDGEPIRADDVVFSWQLLRDHGRPNHRSYYSKVSEVQTPDIMTVRFVFNESGDREMPLIMGLMPILPSLLIDPDTFEDTTLGAPIGSGPYLVGAVDPGASVTLTRNPDYWGADLAVNRGFYNFDEIRYDYYRDENSLFEAFKKGLVDVMPDSDPTRWSTGYDFPAANDGRIVREEFETGTPKGMTGLVFNTRREIFSDLRVREALAGLFDFKWVNQTYFFNTYARTGSYFQASELSALGRPVDAHERELLAPFGNAVLPAVMDGSYQPVETDGSGRDRGPMRQALKLFADAGYVLKGNTLVNAASGAAFSFEILTKTREQERLALAYKRSLSRIGIDISIRTVDSAQYQRRLQTFDYDMIEYSWGASLSPGNEQSFRWSMAAADQEGSFNFAGAKEPAIDAMIAALLSAESREDFVSAVRALDRVLISGHYVVPLYHLPNQWVARWAWIGRPEKTSLYGYLPQTWWAAQAK